MTDVLPDRETRTQPVAHRRYTPGFYDVNATAIMRRGEGLIFDTTGEIPRYDVPLSHTLTDELLDYGTAPTVPPTIPPPPPKPSFVARLLNPERPTGDPRPEPIPVPPADWRPAHRRTSQLLWAHVAGYSGTLLVGVIGGATAMFTVLSVSGHVW